MLPANSIAPFVYPHKSCGSDDSEKFGLTANMYKVFLSLMLLSLIPLSPAKADGVQHTSIAVMDFGSSSTGRLVAEKVAENLKSETEMIVLDRDQCRVAARGIGYSGSLNLSVQEARDLGAAIGSDFYI